MILHRDKFYFLVFCDSALKNRFKQKSMYNVMFQLFWTKNYLECEKLISTSTEERITEYCGRQSVVYLKISSRTLTSNLCTTVKWPGDETCRHTHVHALSILYSLHKTCDVDKENFGKNHL
jgi:hypothetical protein